MSSNSCAFVLNAIWIQKFMSNVHCNLLLNLVYNNTTNIDIFLACEPYKLHDINLITNELFSLHILSFH
jgi:hypothetical protein